MEKTYVKLLKPHNHEGVDRAPGDVIELTQDLAEWVENIGVGKIVIPAVTDDKPATGFYKTKKEK